MTKSNPNGSNATIIHVSLQGKGGVGKSLVATILSQYLEKLFSCHTTIYI
jgi:cellulose biosynthesis protein BcsQ